MFKKKPSRNVGFTLPGGLRAIFIRPKKKSRKSIKYLLILAGLIPFLFTKPVIAQIRTAVPQTAAVPGATQTPTDKATQKRIKELIAQLGDKRANVRNSAADALGKIGQPAVQPLIKALSDRDSRVRISAIDTLSQIGQPAVQSLIKALEDEDISVRLSAARILGQIGDPQAVQPLIKALSDRNSGVRGLAAMALGRIGDPQAVQPLIRALEDNIDGVRLSAAEALGKLGDPQAVQSLIKTLEDENESVRRYAAGALRRIGDPQAVRVLRKRALASKASDVLLAVIRLLVLSVMILVLCSPIFFVVNLVLVLKYKRQNTEAVTKVIRATLVYFTVVIGLLIPSSVIFLFILGLVLIIVLKYKGYNTETISRALLSTLVYLTVVILVFWGPGYLLIVGLGLHHRLCWFLGHVALSITWGPIIILLRDILGYPAFGLISARGPIVYIAILFLPLFFVLYLKKRTVRTTFICVQVLFIILHSFVCYYFITYHDLFKRISELVRP